MGDCWRCDATQHTCMRGTTQHSQPECKEPNEGDFSQPQPAGIPPCPGWPSGRTCGGRFMASSVRLEMCCSGMSMYLQTWNGDSKAGARERYGLEALLSKCAMGGRKASGRAQHSCTIHAVRCKPSRATPRSTATQLRSSPWGCWRSIN